MLGVLLKKQIAEVFRSYFYDAKKNKMRSKGAIAGWIVLFVFLIVGVLGGMFTVLSLSLCGPLMQSGVGWLYFLLMCGLAVLMGAFGSVFNTFSGLYLARDNDLLLSLPIPARTIMAARLINVYLLGAMYALPVMLPTLIVSWITAGVTAPRLICGLLLILIVTFFVLVLSCLLGWVVARVSLRIRHKSFIGVLLSLLFIGAYYFFYFRATDLIRDLLLNAESYGEKIRGAAHVLYLFGRIGEGDWPAALLCTAVMASLCALVWIVLERSFLKIATAGGSTQKVRYVEKAVRQKSAFGALLAKELGRFTASANYMLNCGLGVILIPAAGVLLLLKGQEISSVLGQVFPELPDIVAVLLCTLLCTLSSMNDMTVPAVSLEGKSLWIPRSLPVTARTVLRAKIAVQLILTLIPLLFSSVCAALIIDGTAALRVLLVVTPLLYELFSATCGLIIGIRMPLLDWTSELAPIKQSGGVLLAIFGSWVLSLAIFGLYLLAGRRLGAVPYLAIWCFLLAAGSLAAQRWLDTRGAEAFEAL